MAATRVTWSDLLQVWLSGKAFIGILQNTSSNSCSKGDSSSKKKKKGGDQNW